MKILFISHKFFPDIGGIEVNSEILAAKFSAKGHQVKMVTWSKLKSQSKEFPFTVIRHPGLLQLFRLHAWADVVYENNPSLRLSWPLLFFRKPSVIALRTWLNNNKSHFSYQQKAKNYWLKKAAAVIAVSKAVKDQCWPQATVIGNPYRVDLFTNLHLERNFQLVYLGRLVPDKGVQLLVEAINQLNTKSTNSNVTLTIIGDGPEKSSLESLVAKYNLNRQVIFKGPMQGKELVHTLNQHQFIVVPSLWDEPFGNVALEGLACGCIPIVSDGGGLPDAVGSAGLIFKSGDVNDLTEKLNLILSNKDLQEELRSKATHHLKNHHPDVVSGKYLQIIENAAKRN